MKCLVSQKTGCRKSTENILEPICAFGKVSEYKTNNNQPVYSNMLIAAMSNATRKYDTAKCKPEKNV